MSAQKTSLLIPVLVVFMVAVSTSGCESVFGSSESVSVDVDPRDETIWISTGGELVAAQLVDVTVKVNEAGTFRFFRCPVMEANGIVELVAATVEVRTDDGRWVPRANTCEHGWAMIVIILQEDRMAEYKGVTAIGVEGRMRLEFTYREYGVDFDLTVRSSEFTISGLPSSPQ